MGGGECPGDMGRALPASATGFILPLSFVEKGPADPCAGKPSPCVLLVQPQLTFPQASSAEALSAYPGSGRASSEAFR